MANAIDIFLEKVEEEEEEEKDMPTDARDIFLENASRGYVGPEEPEGQSIIPSELTTGGTIGAGISPEDIEETAYQETDDSGREPARVDARDKFLKNVERNYQDPRDKFLGQVATIAEQEEGETLKDKLFKGIVAVGEFFDRYSGAPTRSALRAFLEDEPVIKSAYEQFGEDPSKAPEGKQIAAESLGLPTKEITIPPYLVESMIGPEPGKVKRDPKTGKIFIAEPEKRKNVKFSPAGAVGLGIDIFADPLGFVPLGKIAMKAGKILKSGTKYALKGSAAAIDMAMNSTRITDTGQIIGRSLDDIGKSLKELFEPKVAKDFKYYKNIAEKNNIDVDLLPESVEFGKDSFISKASRQRRELGGKSAEKFEEAVKQIGDAIDAKIKNISNTDTVMDNVSAGALLRDAYDRGVERFFSDMDVTHNIIMKNNPGLQITEEGMQNLEKTLRGIERFAKGRIKRGADPVFVSQGQRLLRNVENIRNTNGSYKQALEALREIGEIAYTSKNVMATIPADISRMRTIYNSLNNALIDTVEKKAIFKRGDEIIKGGELANNLILNNRRMTEFFGDKAVLKRIGDKNIANEALFDSIFTRGDTRKIEALKSIISLEDLNDLKAAFLENMIKKNQDGNVMFRSTFNSLFKKRDVVNSLFNKKEISEIMELLSLGDRVGIPVLSTSGTGASNVLSGISNTFKEIISNDLLIESLKKSARTKEQIEALSRLPNVYGKNQAITIIKAGKFPKKVERAAINKIRKIPQLFEKPRTAIKGSQVISVQERQRKNDEEKGY